MMNTQLTYWGNGKAYQKSHKIIFYGTFILKYLII
jgi:hypothetical protein